MSSIIDSSRRHNCGLVINPEGLQRTIESRMLYGMSRALHEEVKFDAEKVDSGQ